MRRPFGSHPPPFACGAGRIGRQPLSRGIARVNLRGKRFLTYSLEEHVCFPGRQVVVTVTATLIPNGRSGKHAPHEAHITPRVYRCYGNAVLAATTGQPGGATTPCWICSTSRLSRCACPRQGEPSPIVLVPEPLCERGRVRTRAREGGQVGFSIDTPDTDGLPSGRADYVEETGGAFP